jgi:hypothetical protein
MLAGLLIPVEAQSWLPITEIESIEVFMESLFGFLSTLELHPRFFNARIARESFEQYERLLVSAISCLSPATANAAAKVSSSGGRASLPVAIFINSGTSSRKALK